jgi:hypothetical protein
MGVIKKNESLLHSSSSHAPHNSLGSIWWLEVNLDLRKLILDAYSLDLGCSKPALGSGDLDSGAERPRNFDSSVSSSIRGRHRRNVKFVGFDFTLGLVVVVVSTTDVKATAKSEQLKWSRQ